MLDELKPYNPSWPLIPVLVVSQASRLFFKNVLENLLVKAQIGYKFSELVILLFQLSKPAQI
jgi:hypothetical protein